MITRADVVRELRTWAYPKPTPFRHQASLRGVGTDCIGVVIGVARELGIALAAQFDASEEIKGYGREPDPVMLLRACNALLDPCTDPLPGDILLMRFQAEPQHFGIISAPEYIIHAYASARRVVENRIDDLWRSRIVRAYSYRGISG